MGRTTHRINVHQLTERERQVLELVARGMTNVEIAAELGITFNTAKNHLHAILDKLGVESREEAARVFRQEGSLRNRVLAFVSIPILRLGPAAGTVAVGAVAVVGMAVLIAMLGDGEEDVDTVTAAGSGPELRWEEVDPPGSGTIDWIVGDEERFYLADSNGEWFASEDGMGWDLLASPQGFPESDSIWDSRINRDPYDHLVAREGTIAALTFPTITVVDTQTGTTVRTRLLESVPEGVDDPCLAAILEASPRPDSCVASEYARIVAGPHGFVVNAWAASPVPVAWFSRDGRDWSPVPAEGPWAPHRWKSPTTELCYAVVNDSTGDACHVVEDSDAIGLGPHASVAAVEDGFVLLRPQGEYRDCSVGGEAWFSSDGRRWVDLNAQVGSPSCTELVGWGERAVAAAWEPETFVPTADRTRWLVSSQGISQLVGEQLPELQRWDENVYAGNAGIVVRYTGDVESLAEKLGWDYWGTEFLEFSVDGKMWYRTAIDDETRLEGLLRDAPILVGDVSILTYHGDTLFVGKPEE